MEWKTEKRKIKDLKILKINPRIIDNENKEKLAKSLNKFDLVEIPVVNTDNTVIAGNQRINILKEQGLDEIDVRVPSRRLEEKEIKEYNLMSNLHAGEWDFEALKNDYIDVLEGMDFAIENLEKYMDGVNIDPYKEWQGMPEYENENLQTDKIVVHFKDENARQEFAKLIGQKITKDTQYIYFPKEEKLEVAGKMQYET